MDSGQLASNRCTSGNSWIHPPPLWCDWHQCAIRGGRGDMRNHLHMGSGASPWCKGFASWFNYCFNSFLMFLVLEYFIALETNTYITGHPIHKKPLKLSASQGSTLQLVDFSRKKKAKQSEARKLTLKRNIFCAYIYIYIYMIYIYIYIHLQIPIYIYYRILCPNQFSMVLGKYHELQVFTWESQKR